MADDRSWMHLDGSHRVPAHRGVRTHRHKLVHDDGEGLPDLHADPAHADLFEDLKTELRLSDEVRDVVPEEDPRRSPVRTREPT